MPIRTLMKKSGQKKVFDRRATGAASKLNRSARDVFRGVQEEVSPGTRGLTTRVKTGENLASKRRRGVILQNRRRRHTG